MLRMFINLWPPYWGTGIHINKMTKDFRYIEVSMKLRWYNKNYVGTHFGGSMYAMTDPFYMLMLIKNLGEDYIIWDKASCIEFKKPGKGTLRAIFQFSEEEIHSIRNQANQNEKFIFDRSVDLINQDGVVVATVVKTLYVRKKSLL
ncbi:MAG: DUF4442 domain-containing protein [Gammaproteobacteria bacterium]|nr:DUF4442 domain-containing protein [Gammaproteobacteria bacterium]MCW5582376.1 DUF4442 domain-containing protein [Gammaproteobacteria bacterium]